MVIIDNIAGVSMAVSASVAMTFLTSVEPLAIN